jgi:hypothetical protein
MHLSWNSFPSENTAGIVFYSTAMTQDEGMRQWKAQRSFLWV